MLHTLFSDVPVEQQETVAGGNEISCSCSNTKLEGKDFNEEIRSNPALQDLLTFFIANNQWSIFP
jgi:hypothetical protein